MNTLNQEIEEDEDQVVDGIAETVEDDIEGQARRMGWVPKEEFRGDPARWTDAKSFVDRGQTELPILRERNRTLDRRLESTERELKEVKEVLVEVREFNSRSEERAFNRAKTELEQQRREAVEQADVGAVETIQRQIDELEPPKPVTKPATPPNTGTPEVDAVTREWGRQNPWFLTDPEMNATAQAIHTALGKSNPDMPLRENLAEVRRRVMLAYPERFDNPRRQAPAAVAPTTPTTQRRTTGKTYEDLPPDAKKQCDKFVKQIPGYKREQYVADYDWN